MSCTSGELADEGQMCFNEMASLQSPRAELWSRELEDIPEFIALKERGKGTLHEMTDSCAAGGVQAMHL